MEEKFYLEIIPKKVGIIKFNIWNNEKDDIEETKIEKVETKEEIQKVIKKWKNKVKKLNNK